MATGAYTSFVNSNNGIFEKANSSNSRFSVRAMYEMYMNNMENTTFNWKTPDPQDVFTASI
jgi:hypothetical protein